MPSISEVVLANPFSVPQLQAHFIAVSKQVWEQREQNNQLR